MAARLPSRIKNGLSGPSGKQLEMAMSSCQYRVDPSGFEERVIDAYIGAGIFTSKIFKKGDFLLEYQGDLIKYKEAKRRESDYKNDEEIDSFMFFFKYKGTTMCVDATNEVFSYGRMVNDASPGSMEENCSMKIVVVNREPHLCLFATRYIKPGEELRYDYGVPDLPWRKKKNYINESNKKVEITNKNNITEEVSNSEQREIKGDGNIIGEPMQESNPSEKVHGPMHEQIENKNIDEPMHLIEKMGELTQNTEAEQISEQHIQCSCKSFRCTRQQ